MKRNTIFFSSPVSLFYFVCFFFCSFLASYAQSFSTVDGQNLKKVSVNKIITESGVLVDLPSLEAVSELGISGTITLNTPQGFVRVLLQASNGLEYLVYEANSFSIEGFTTSFQAIAEETKVLTNVVPVKIKVELSDAHFNLAEVVVLPSTASASFRKEDGASLRRQQAEEKVAQINANIKKRGLKWRAGVTSLSLLSYEQKKYVFGGKIPNLQGAEYYKGGILSVSSVSGATPIATSGASPYIESFDWRNRHGQNWITPVTNQGGCSSCWAFATVATTEQLINLYYNRHINPDLSEQDALSCSGAGNCINGGNTNATLDYIQTTGVVNETCFSYAASDLACANKCAAPQERIKIGGYENFYGSTEDELKAMLIQGPVSGGLSSWWHTMNLVAYKTVKVGDQISLNAPYNIVTIQPGDPLIGTTVWTFKNSWGPDYGENGYVTVSTPMSNFYLTHRLYGPIVSKTYTNSYISCTDNDRDGYYFWGLGPKPSHCPASPAEPDGDDSNSNLGPLNAFGHCRVIGTNRPPVVVDDYISANGFPNRITITDVLLNDSDPDGDRIYLYGVNDSPYGELDYDGDSRYVAFIPNEGFVGTATIPYIVSDSKGNRTIGNLHFTVLNSRYLPTVTTAIPDQSLVKGAASKTINLNNHFADRDGDFLTYSLFNSYAGASITGSTLTISSAIEGSFDITVVARDNSEGMVLDAFKLTITTSTGDICLEAESAAGQTTFAPYQVYTDGNASGSSYILVPNGTGNLSSAPTSNNIATLAFNVANAGSYNIWLRILASSTSDNDVYLKVDNASFNTFAPSTASNWTWRKWTSKSLTAGSHTISIGRKEDGLKIDKVLLTTSSSSPSGMGCGLAREEDWMVEEETTEESSALEIAPNPTSGRTVLMLKGNTNTSSVDIYNSLGNLVNSFETTGRNMIELETSQLISGVYFVKFNNGNEIITKSLVVKK